MISIDLWYILETAGLSFLFFTLVFVPMEKIFPARKDQKFFRPHWLLDFCFFMGQYLLWGAFVLWAMNYFETFLLSIVPIAFQKGIANQPFILQIFAVLIISDFLIYWGHRLQHKIDFLWRFHKVHHSAKHLDWLAAHTEHPLDLIFSLGLLHLPAFVL